MKDKEIEELIDDMIDLAEEGILYTPDYFKTKYKMDEQLSKIKDNKTALLAKFRELEQQEGVIPEKQIVIVNDLSEKYYELLYAVETKHQSETRHETALRYIREAEHRGENEGAKQNAKEM